jgi:hypothetical protein
MACGNCRTKAASRRSAQRVAHQQPLHSAAAGSSTVVPPISISEFVPTLSVSTAAGPSTIGTGAAPNVSSI